MSGRGHCLQTVVIVAAVYDADELNQKRVKLELVVAVISADQGDGRRRTGLSASRRGSEGTNFVPQGIQDDLVRLDTFGDSFFQLTITRRVDHCRFSPVVLAIISTLASFRIPSKNVMSRV